MRALLLDVEQGIMPCASAFTTGIAARAMVKLIASETFFAYLLLLPDE